MQWSLAAGSGAASCTYPNTATWFVGPIANNPLVASRLTKAGITSTAWSYGVGDGGSCGVWGGNDLLGFSQVGNTLTIARFTSSSGVDQTAPVDQITYTLGTATAPSTAPVTSFQAGTYRSPSTILSGQGIITLAGPGSAGGGIQWSLAAASGAASCTYPSTATWFVGPIASNPLVAARLAKAGITSTAWSYGVGNGGSCGVWGTNDLLGFSQIGNTLTIARFTSSSGVDQAVPVDQITYTLVP